MNWGRLLRIYLMIAAVSVVSLFVFGAQFSNAALSLLSVAVGTVALVSLILGAMLSATAYLSEPPAERSVVSND